MYGAASPLANADVKAKAKRTVLKKYSVDNVAKASQIKALHQKTSLLLIRLNHRLGIDIMRAL